MKIYDPTVIGPERHNYRAPPIDNVNGLTIGILENGKLNAVEFLQEIAGLFQINQGCMIGPVYSKFNASAPATPDILQNVVKNVDFLVTGLGDWGSCSTCSLHDGISFEQLGKRAVVICTSPFEITAKNIARMMGLPNYPFVIVEHPIGSRSSSELKMLAKQAYKQALKLLNWN